MSNQLLTPEERAILAEPEETQPAKTAAPEPAKPAAAEPAEETPAAASAPVFVPQQPEYDTGQIQAALDDSARQQSELQRKFDDGELSIDEFVIEQSRISDAKAQATAAAAIAENNFRTNEEVQAQLWERDQKAFFQQNPSFEKNPALFGALDQIVKTLAEDPSNQDKTGAWILQQAKREVESQLQSGGGSVPSAAVSTGSRRGPSAPVAAADLSQFERTVETGNFRSLESQLARMSPAEADAFLRGE